MVLNALTIEGFRNYEKDAIQFDPGTNVIVGENGQGKTNLLEAIYYLAGAKSFRTRFDKELIGFDKESSRIKAEISSEEREQIIEVYLKRGKSREIHINGAKRKRGADIGGKLMAVLFSPDDLAIVRAGASVRRRLLDNSISQLRPKYALWLSEFGRLYEHKTRILKDHREKPALLDTLDDFNLRLAKASSQLIHYRAAFVEKLAQHADFIHRAFSGDKEGLSITYKTVRTIDNPKAPPSVLFDALMDHQSQLRQTEIDAGLCLSGAHKDDFLVHINGVLAKPYASQGQTRTAALSIKLSEREIFFQDRGEYPLLLLDDVLSELDAARQDFVLNRIKEGQVFITCCEDRGIAKRTGGKIFTVKKGRVV